MRKILLTLAVLIPLWAGARVVQNIDNGWQFLLGDVPLEELDGGTGWRQVDVPHDWSIEGVFDRSNPTGQGGAYLPAGIGWYRKTIKTDIAPDERLFLEFDGVMACSSVYVNGKLAGYRPNGYVGFSYDITDLVTPGNDAVVAVRVDNSVQPASRWYTGSGINRHVRLVRKNACHIPMDGVFVSFDDGKLNVKATVSNTSDKSRKVRLQLVLKDADGKVVTRGNGSDVQIAPGEQAELTLNSAVKSPHFWSLDDPYLYTLEVSLSDGRKEIDSETVTTGLRTIRFDNEKGFFLNGPEQLVPYFPGRTFEVEGWASYNKKLKQTLLADVEKASIAVRNFPLSVAELRKTLKIGDGDETYLFATTLKGEQKIVIRTKKTASDEAVPLVFKM